MTDKVPIVGPEDRFGELEAIQGETFSGEIILCQGDGVTPVDLSGYTVTFYIWKESVLKKQAVCVLVAADGVIKLSLSAAETAALSPVSHHFELWADNGEGQVKLLLHGWLWVHGTCQG